jgi:hypothetical protein
MELAKTFNNDLHIAAGIAARRIFHAKNAEARALSDRLYRVLHTDSHNWKPEERSAFTRLCAAARASPRHPPPEVIERLVQVLALAGLREWANQHAAADYVRNRQLPHDWLSFLEPENQKTLLEAASRFAADRSDASDRHLLKTSLQNFLKENKPMPSDFKFDFDTRGLPPDFLETGSDKFQTEVDRILKESVGLQHNAGSDDVTIAAIKGTLLLNELFDPTAFGFRSAVTDAWAYSLETTKRLKPNDSGSLDATNREMFLAVATEIVKISPGPIFFQELAGVSRYVIDNATQIPIDHSNFPMQVRIGLQKYVEAQPPAESFDLPLLTADVGKDISIEPPNVEAVSIIYTALQVDPRMRLFHVVDRITELFMNGLLPVGPGNASKALDDYYWNADERLTEPARNAVYARVLGAPGVDVSKEVTPNRPFDDLFVRFVSSLAEYDRQRRVADLFENKGRSLALTGEQVRKAGRDLGGNVSLYGWGGTQPVARRLKQHILTALAILDAPEIQKVYGVSNPYQVIERVALNEFGQAPNIVKYKTLADAGKIILRLIAKYADAWSVNTGRPLFLDPANQTLGSDISTTDERQLMLQAQNIIAVNGMSDEQVGKLSAPSDTTYAPSVPAFGAVSTAPVSGNGSGDLVTKLQQMVAAGTPVSADQIKQLLPAMKM